MHRTIPWVSLFALGLLASGCGTPSGDSAARDESDDEAPAAEATVFDDMLETQDRARAVEDLNDERRELLESAIEAGEEAPVSDEDVSR